MSFLAPNFLYLLPLSLIPVVIHFLHRLRLEKIYFSSLFFLRETQRERFNWLRIKEILLLLFRTLFLFFLLASLSKPRCERSPLGIKGEKSLVLVLDDTYSMMYREKGKMRFELAKEKILELLSLLAKKSEVSLFLLSDRLATPFLPKDSIIKILDTLSCSYLSPRLSVEKIEKKTSTARYGTEIYFFTDLQENCREIISQPWPAPPTIFDLGGEGKNCGVRDVNWQEKLALPLEVNHIASRIKNYAEEGVGLKVKLQLKEREEWQEVFLKPREEKEVVFKSEFLEPGDYSGRVEIFTDSLAPDNTFYFSLKKLDKVPVLVLGGERERMTFLAKALVPTEISPFSLTLLPFSSLGQIDLTQFRVVILVDPLNLRLGERERLRRYLRGGGSLFLLIFSPPQVNLWEDYFTFLGNKREEGFLRVERVDSLHPALAAIRDEIKSFRVFAYALLRPNRAKVLLNLTGGVPFLLEAREERVLILSSLFQPDFTDLVYKGVSIPFLYRFLFYLANLTLEKSYLCGETIRVSTPSLITEVKGPMGSWRETGEIKEGRIELELQKTSLPGIYQIGEETFALNPDPREGDLTRLKERDLIGRKLRMIKELKSERVDLKGFSLIFAFFFILLEFFLVIF